MKDELKPCPFCGGTNVRTNLHIGENYSVECVTCTAHIFSGYMHGTEEDAIKAWNRRHVDLEGLEGVIAKTIDAVDDHNIRANKHNDRGMTYMPYRNLTKELATAIREYLR